MMYFQIVIVHDAVEKLSLRCKFQNYTQVFRFLEIIWENGYDALVRLVKRDGSDDI